MPCSESTSAASEAATSALAQALTGPAKVAGDAGSVEQHKLKDLIEADKYLRGQQAACRRGRGLRITKLLPPGTV